MKYTTKQLAALLGIPMGRNCTTQIHRTLRGMNVEYVAHTQRHAFDPIIWEIDKTELRKLEVA